MLKLIIYRFLQGIVVLFIISFLIFWLLAAAGGDALTALRNNPLVSQETLAELGRIYGLDQSLTVRYTHWLSEAARGRLGHSFYFKMPVGRIIWPCLIKTVLLAAVAISIAWAIALALGITAARHAGTWIDSVCSVIVTFAASTSANSVGPSERMRRSVGVGWPSSGGSCAVNAHVSPRPVRSSGASSFLGISTCRLYQE